MKKKLLFCLLIFISFSLFADDRFEMVTCWNLVNINYEIYVELKYNTSTPIFVSDELVTGFFYSEEDENVLNMIYYPRATLIKYGKR